MSFTTSKCQEILLSGFRRVALTNCFMTTHNVDFCKNELRVMPLTIFHLNLILLRMMKMITNNRFVKSRAEYRCTLKFIGTIITSCFDREKM